MELIKSIDETFKFEDKEIRVIGTYNEPLFVAKDICNILELSNITEALRNIPEKWKGSEILNTLTRGNQTMIILKEAAVYQLVLRSTKPIAKKFQETVCENILPSLRKKGEYKIQSIIDKNKQLEDEKQKILEEKKQIEDNFIDLSEKHFKLDENHKRILYKNKRHRLKKGPCLYLLHNPDIPETKQMIKLGRTNNLNIRRTTYNTYLEPEFLYVMFTNDNALLEDILYP